MEPSLEYVLMCEKATKLQEQWQPNAGDCVSWDGVVLTLGTPWYRAGQDIIFCGQGILRERISPKDLVWLPRQDQLWEMIKTLRTVFLYRYGDNTYEIWYLGRQWTGKDIEPLLLQVYMYRNNKSWNGTEWIGAANL